MPSVAACRLSASATTSAAQQQVQTLNRVLDETADSYAKLQQEHAAKLEELAWYQRWVHGRRREKVVDGEGQQHLFELTAGDDSAAANSSQPCQPVASHSRRRHRELDLSGLPHLRHETDLSPVEKIGDCCGCSNGAGILGGNHCCVYLA